MNVEAAAHGALLFPIAAAELLDKRQYSARALEILLFPVRIDGGSAAVLKCCPMTAVYDVKEQHDGTNSARAVERFR